MVDSRLGKYTLLSVSLWRSVEQEMQNGWPTAFLMNILKSLGGRLPLPISQLVFIYNRNEWTPLTTLRMCLTRHGIRQVMLGNAHTYQERTSKQTNKNWMSIVRWCLDWRFFWDLRSLILVKIKFLWAQSNTPWGIPRENRKGHPYLFGLDCWGTAVPTIIVAEGSVVDGVTVVVPHERLESEKAERLRTWTWINSNSCQNKMKPWRSHIVCNITDCPEKQEIIIPLSFQSRQKKKDTRALVGFSHPTWEDASRILIWLGPENSIKASKFVSPFDNFKLTFWNYVGKEEGYV